MLVGQRALRVIIVARWGKKQLTCTSKDIHCTAVTALFHDASYAGTYAER